MLLLGACALEPYRYNEDGYWSARARPAASIVVYGGYCSPGFGYGYGPTWYAWHPCFGSPFAYSPYYGSGFYALYDPFWPYHPAYSYGGHRHPGDARVRAYDAARRLSDDLANDPERRFTSYESLGPVRGRDLGPGGGETLRSYPSTTRPDGASDALLRMSGSARGYEPASGGSYDGGLSSRGSGAFSGSGRSGGLSSRSSSSSGASSRSSSGSSRSDSGSSSRSSSESGSSSRSRQED
jgi:hypothetical protein